MNKHIFKNYLKVAFRFLSKEKSITFISILGLALTLVASSLIYQYVSYEESYDEWSASKDLIHRVYMDNYTNETRIQSLATTFSAVGPQALEQIPEVEDYVRLFGFSFELDYHVMSILKDSVTQDWFNGQNIFISTPSFFDFFDRKALYGDLTLDKKGTVVISKSLAERHYPNENPVGQLLKSDLLGYLTISGVFDDFPANSHLQVDMLLPWDKISADDDNNWRSLYNTYNYLKLKDTKQATPVQEKLNQLFLDNRTDRHVAENTVFEFHLTPIAEIQLREEELYRDFASKGNPNLIAALKLIGLILLAIGITNYLNLLISRSRERLREIGIRRVLSGGQSSIFLQFFAEGLLVMLLTLTLSIGLLYLGLAPFNEYLGLDGSYSILTNSSYWIILLLIGTLVPVLAGTYPALSLKKVQIAKALKGKSEDIRLNLSLRRTLITFQFTATIFLVFLSFVIFRQLDGMQNQTLGFSTDQVMVLPTYQTRMDSATTMKFHQVIDRLSNHSQVQSATVGSSIPGYSIRQSVDFRTTLADMDSKTPFQSIRIDNHFFETFGMDLIAGRSFTPEFSKADHDRFNMVINESAAKALGYVDPVEAVGQYMYYHKDRKCQIIGVVKDFNQQSLHHTIAPMTFYNRGLDRNRFFSVRLTSSDIQNSIALVEETWSSVFPGEPFEYFFLDGYFAQQYQQDHIIRNVMSVFSILILLISAVGLLGMISLIISQRMQELGIRKVLGASRKDLYELLGKEYVFIIAIALLIGCPIGYWSSINWLEQYAWRIEVTWLAYAVPVVLLFGISIIVMSLRINWIARINPIEVLRDE